VKKSCFVTWAGVAWLYGLFPFPGAAQIPFSSGAYSNSFDSLGAVGAAWTNNLTLAGWYASKGNADATNYFASTGTGTTGGLYSFGDNGTHPNSDRALGSLAGSSTTYAFGVRFSNDTASSVSNVTVSCVGEQWRSGGENMIQTLAFSWRIADSPITNSYSGANWSNFPALNFASPNLGDVTTALDGNAATNRQLFSGIVLTGVVVNPGQELFLRWLDVDDGGFDNALAIEDLTVTFAALSAVPPFINLQPESQVATQGDTVTFTVVAGGTPPPSYQWRFLNANLAGATSSALTLTNVTPAQNGDYYAVVTNTAGGTNSQPASLTVYPPPPSGTTNTLSLLTYNVKGNGVTDWSTNSAQVQAIGRQLQYLKPDIITFQEIPNALSYEMTNFVNVFLPGYALARNSGTDGFIRSMIASRFPITRSTSWLDGMDLRAFGYSNANNNLDDFTRDLFEAEIAAPDFPRPLHVFTTHLKSTSDMTYEEASAKRAAEAAAITNFFATNLLVLYPFDPYALTGDMNDSDTNAALFQRLLSIPTGLKLTNPKNPITGSINTYSIQASLNGRLDYIFPNGLLFSNIKTSQVFRTDLLDPVPPNLNSNDDQVASDHLPVLMVFNNPYDRSFRITSITRSNPNVTLQWESIFGQPYRVDGSSNLTAWNVLASNLTATSHRFTLSTNLAGDEQFFRVYRVP